MKNKNATCRAPLCADGFVKLQIYMSQKSTNDNTKNGECSRICLHNSLKRSRMYNMECDN